MFVRFGGDYPAIRIFVTTYEFILMHKKIFSWDYINIYNWGEMEGELPLLELLVFQ
jgi:hypothetical protein